MFTCRTGYWDNQVQHEPGGQKCESFESNNQVVTALSSGTQQLLALTNRVSKFNGFPFDSEILDGSLETENRR